MFSHAVPFSGVPTGTLDMTADLAPLLIGTWVLLGLCVLFLAFAIGFHDTRKALHADQGEAPKPETLPEAA